MLVDYHYGRAVIIKHAVTVWTHTSKKCTLHVWRNKFPNPKILGWQMKFQNFGKSFFNLWKIWIVTPFKEILATGAIYGWKQKKHILQSECGCCCKDSFALNPSMSLKWIKYCLESWKFSSIYSQGTYRSVNIVTITLDPVI